MRLWAALLVLLPAIARADAVPNPRTQCPDGARAESYHWGEACEPLDCRSDIDCDKNMECVDAPLCIEKGTHETSTGMTVTGACSRADPTCATPATCSTSSKRCVNRGLARRYISKCGCGASGEADASWALVVGLALAWRRIRSLRGARGAMS